MKTTSHRRAFSLVELLVVITLIVMLVAMMATALNAARASGKVQKSRASIAALDAILQGHFASCESTPLSPENAAADIGVAIRKRITEDLPDSWVDVDVMAQSPNTYRRARQRGYAATWLALPAGKRLLPGQPGYPPADPELEGQAREDAGRDFVQYLYSDSECLFMIVMQGGLADCLTCSSLDSVAKGDKDGDGMLEFWDAWDQPIRYVLWPSSFQLPVGSPFFSQTIAPFSNATIGNSTTGTMRPLLVSGGPNKEASISINDGSYLSLGSGCGVPSSPGFGGPGDVDNITNYDDKVKR